MARGRAEAAKLGLGLARALRVGRAIAWVEEFMTVEAPVVDSVGSLDVVAGRFFGTDVTVTRVPMLAIEDGPAAVREVLGAPNVDEPEALRIERLVLIISNEGTTRAP